MTTSALSLRRFAASNVDVTKNLTAAPERATASTPARRRATLDYGVGLTLPPGQADSRDIYEGDLQQVIDAMPLQVVRYIDAYTPRRTSPSVWASLAAFVKLAVFSVAPQNKHTVDQAMSAMVHLAIWGCVEKGLPPKYRLLLSSEVIGRWQSEMLASESLAEGTVRNYRGHLARIAHALGVEIDGRFDTITRTARSRPYSATELEKLLLWARTLTSDGRRRALAVLCLSAGAGLTPLEVFDVRAGDVVTAGGMWVRVGEPDARLTPVLETWRPRLRQLVEEAGPNGFLFPRYEDANSSDLVTAWAGRQPSKIRPHPTRLRTTWIVEMLRLGGNDAQTLAYAGIERGETLAGYLPLLGEVDRIRRTAMVRLSAETGNAAHRAVGGHLRDHSGESAGAGENS